MIRMTHAVRTVEAVRSRLRPLAWLATVTALGTGAATIAACSGKVYNGTVGSTAQAVALPAISGAATPCDTGYAHPNVCCEAGPGQAASCVVYPQAPFTQCEGSATTYPDPRSCCPLDGQGACAAPPPAAVDAGSGGGGSCAYACPVGWYSPPVASGAGSSGSSGGSAGTTCCQAAPDGSGLCMGSASAGGSGCTCACPACDTDGSCPPCPPCNCPEQPAPSAPSCDACPPGWQAPQGEPLLCCAEGADGTITCFSQGVPPPAPGPEPVDAGPASVPASCFGGGGGSADGGPTFTQCGCSETVNGTDYTVTCTDPGGTCVCSVGSGGTTGTTGTTVPEPATSCDDLGALFGACGFPATGFSGAGGGGAGSGGSPGSSSSSSGG